MGSNTDPLQHKPPNDGAMTWDLFNSLTKGPASAAMLQPPPSVSPEAGAGLAEYLAGLRPAAVPQDKPEPQNSPKTLSSESEGDLFQPKIPYSPLFGLSDGPYKPVRQARRP